MFVELSSLLRRTLFCLYGVKITKRTTMPRRPTRIHLCLQLGPQNQPHGSASAPSLPIRTIISFSHLLFHHASFGRRRHIEALELAHDGVQRVLSGHAQIYGDALAALRWEGSRSWTKRRACDLKKKKIDQVCAPRHPPRRAIRG